MDAHYLRVHGVEAHRYLEFGVWGSLQLGLYAFTTAYVDFALDYRKVTSDRSITGYVSVQRGHCDNPRKFPPLVVTEIISS